VTTEAALATGAVTVNTVWACLPVHRARPIDTTAVASRAITVGAVLNRSRHTTAHASILQGFNQGLEDSLPIRFGMGMTIPLAIVYR